MTTAARAAVAALPNSPGVYRFRGRDQSVLYVGRATNLRRRVASYWSDLRDRAHLAPMVDRIARIEAVRCDSEHEAAWLERNLLEEQLPAGNRTQGQEVVVYLHLDAQLSAPRLRVVHAAPRAGGDDHFGPYLGGLKARLAVAALHRVLPLAYSGTALSGAEQEMAGKFAIDPSHRKQLVEALVAILRREPSAVADIRARLDARRDDAAARLAFELAGRIQSEIVALDWITCPQRVTSSEPRDFDVYGWSDGVLVGFHIRAGRLRTWTQRSCTRAGARRYLAESPADWADFANTNAELAARLAR
ncbi:GIY-YIG nuclease family protein [Lentzea sp. NPDC004789]